MVEKKDELLGGEETDRQIKKDYKIESVIGKGTFATVRRGKNRCTGEKVAIKILSKEKMAPDDVAGL
jgi:serine/threonine protein kinase